MFHRLKTFLSSFLPFSKEEQRALALGDALSFGGVLIEPSPEDLSIAEDLDVWRKLGIPKPDYIRDGDIAWVNDKPVMPKPAVLDTQKPVVKGLPKE